MTEPPTCIFLRGVIALCTQRGCSPENIEAWSKDDKWVADLWRQAEQMLAIAKWGAPAPVGVEPYGRITTHSVTGQQFFYRWPESPYLDNASECVSVYTTPQPTQMQAVAVPLTDEQIDQAIAELGLNYLADAHATNRAVLRKLCHHAHDIKGGKHGADT